MGCKGCGGPLPPKKPGPGRKPLWCSSECRRGVSRLTEIRCGTCRSVFLPSRRGVKYCSFRCKQKATYLSAKLKRHGGSFSRNCLACGREYEASTGHRKYCGIECRSVATRQNREAREGRLTIEPRECDICGQWFVPSANNALRATRCSLKCARKHGNQTYRAKLAQAYIEPVSPAKVYERDGWVCGICSEPINQNLKYPDLMSASLDHVVPIANGGEHSYANTQASHLICNVRKAHRV